MIVRSIAPVQGLGWPGLVWTVVARPLLACGRVGSHFADRREEMRRYALGYLGSSSPQILFQAEGEAGARLSPRHQRECSAATLSDSSSRSSIAEYGSVLGALSCLVGAAVGCMLNPWASPGSSKSEAVVSKRPLPKLSQYDTMIPRRALAGSRWAPAVGFSRTLQLLQPHRCGLRPSLEILLEK